jgi:hypothetical protein
VPKGFTCNDVLDVFGLNIGQFYKMNPAVKADCSNLWVEQAYCVASPNAPGSDPTSSGVSVAPSSTSKAGPGAPTHTGQPASKYQPYIVSMPNEVANTHLKIVLNGTQLVMAIAVPALRISTSSPGRSSLLGIPLSLRTARQTFGKTKHTAWELPIPSALPGLPNRHQPQPVAS